MNLRQNVLVLLFFAGYFLLSLAVIALYEGTGDAGDSVYHYLYARYAPLHPELFFDHWAKPLYVLLASPFAQFGFKGMKLFNVLCTSGAMAFTYLSSKKLGWKHPLLAAVFQGAIPLGFVLSFSGLTEPLFALLLTSGVFLCVANRPFAAALLISFLPFVRSEGLIIASTFGLYFLIQKNWKALPLLAFGHVAYSLAGWSVHGELLWVLTKIPYANAGSPYGSGELFHFAKQMLYIAGVPLTVLLVIGLLSAFARLSFIWMNPEVTVLIAGGFIFFFIAHSLFWYLGIFNSMGLTRVFVGVSPLMALLAHKGYSESVRLVIKMSPKAGYGFGAAMVAYVLVFPVTAHPGAVRPDRNLVLKADQLCALELAQDEMVMNGHGSYYTAHPFVNMALGIDPFDTEKRLEPSAAVLQNAQPGDIFIWDNWFCVIERNIFRNDAEGYGFRNIGECRREEHGRKIELIAYIKE